MHSVGRPQLAQHWVRSAPGWLVSALVHTVLLTLCGFYTVQFGEPGSAIVVATASATPDVVPEVEVPVFLRDPGQLDTPTLVESDAVDPVPLELDLPLEDPRMEPVFEWETADARSEASAAGAKVSGSQGGAARNGASGAGAQFYGIQAQGDRFVFIVDSSTSMRLKFGEALQELDRSVRQLTPDQQFYVIFFDRDAERLRLGEWNPSRTRYSFNSRPESDFVAPTTENLDGLVQWMRTIQLEGETNPHSAIVFTLKKLQPDAIFLLSDGEFTDGGETEAYLLQNNFHDDAGNLRRPRSIVHCVGFYSRAGEVTLKRIAVANGGSYRFVNPPPGYFSAWGMF